MLKPLRSNAFLCYTYYIALNKKDSLIHILKQWLFFHSVYPLVKPMYVFIVEIPILKTLNGAQPLYHYIGSALYIDNNMNVGPFDVDLGCSVCSWCLQFGCKTDFF